MEPKQIAPEDDGIDHPFDIDDEIDAKDYGRAEDKTNTQEKRDGKREKKKRSHQ